MDGHLPPLGTLRLGTPTAMDVPHGARVGVGASHFMSLRESWRKWHESWKYDIQKVVIRESQGVIQRV